jgi:hypothetical protein
MRRLLTIGILLAGTVILPWSEASAQCWYNGSTWNCPPPGSDLGPLGPLALPFIAVGAVLTGVLTVVTLPFQAIFGPPYNPPPYYPYYAPPPYYPPPGSYAPSPGSHAPPPPSSNFAPQAR